ncbi:hypothetical protein B4O97_19065 [Marispirochaeta aestuarii]|uniref:Transposase DDE domain-containing protein n=1 Tax=Marispirochaeta aestuarii TaxID=1963862 RepID=A0A1Y1RTZ6_9SPIO|nr:IS1380 family transposase [Marispirochaeta aestuarii]ORC27002.1 hypothetical protein B4O97_19065 [Marispirochaeta aestuarii]
MVRENGRSVKSKINDYLTTSELFSGRAGLAPVSRYLDATGITGILAKRFSFLKKNAKGTPLRSIFHQIICYFFDGTDLHLTRFDHLKKDAGYAGVIETTSDEMISSHSAKRFFGSLSIVRVWLFRKVLKQLFLWRLSIEKPEVIKIGIDTMVLDNNDADCREGVEPTYKKVKGFQPLQVFWGRYLIDAIFRNGKAHSNHGNHVQRVVSDTVRIIRKGYRKEAPIIFIADTGFFDQALLEHCDKLNVGLIVGGKMYQDIKDDLDQMPDNSFQEYKKGPKAWFYTEFGNRRKSWKRFYRTIYAKPITEDNGQVLLEYARPELIIYTNIGMGNAITSSILKAHRSDETEISPEAIINAYHFRARDELVNRALKDFGTEHLPFKRFASNAAFYYLMCISFFLFESFKYDMDSPAIKITWYAVSFRRKVLDIAGQIIRSGRRICLKLPEVIAVALSFGELWDKSGSIPRLEPFPV